MQDWILLLGAVLVAVYLLEIVRQRGGTVRIGPVKVKLLPAVAGGGKRHCKTCRCKQH
jgi:hypothetical protein